LNFAWVLAGVAAVVLSWDFAAAKRQHLGGKSASRFSGGEMVANCHQFSQFFVNGDTGRRRGRGHYQVFDAFLVLTRSS
jgi:hypothetical protein